jgi:hypothetical protein
VNTFNSSTNVLPFIHAEGDNINFDKIEREVDLEFELKKERAEHERTRAALQAQTKASQQVVSERQIEIALQNHPELIPEARDTVTKLLLLGEAGELELDSKGKLREKFGTRSLDELTQDYLKENPNFLGSGNAESARASSKPDRFRMTTKEKAAYISEHGQEKYLALPFSKDVKK